MYEIRGSVIGTGEDGEPTISVSSANKLSYDKTLMEQDLILQMKSHFDDVSGEYDADAGDQIYSFYDMKTNSREFVYKGFTFRKPKSKAWEDF